MSTIYCEYYNLVQLKEADVVFSVLARGCILRRPGESNVFFESFCEHVPCES